MTRALICAVVDIASLSACKGEFKRYAERSKTTEARVSVQKLYAGARTYYLAERLDDQMQLLPPQFPASSKIRPGFYVRAYGDLDCDGTYSTFQIHGRVEAGEDGPPGTVAIERYRERE